ncbi:cryptochrome/photolyase family protein [Rubritalea tangerina]|uniref:Cryptochrome/photolyase family protein n=1 Tax=Rubritalea tangerina TaxID=430798 RepID=A0ABW4ZFQ9_9BACT
MRKKCLLWFRKDLRLTDHPALAKAIEEGYEILPVFLYEEGGDWPVGGASKWWLHYALESLSSSVSDAGGRLLMKEGGGDVRSSLEEIIEEHGIDLVYWCRCYEPEAIERDTVLKRELRDLGCEVKSFEGNVLNEPFSIESKSGGPYKVFTPYWKMCRTHEVRSLYEYDLSKVRWVMAEGGDALEDFDLLPRIDWDREFYAIWDARREVGERILSDLAGGKAMAYGEQRDLMGVEGTSRLGPYLAWGQLSPQEVWHRIVAENASEEVHSGYLRQLYWRDFSYHLMYHFPHTVSSPLREEWKLFAWKGDGEVVQAWQEGRTGIPIIDAAMRQLWQTGWMHNRARMLVACFLVKHLQQDWMYGARWFWDTLVDADLANNTMGWQWSAGCGADAAPYFRVFNPITQAEKFDSHGDYVRRYVPELAKLPMKYLNRPWEAPADVLENAGVELGKTYPEPIIDVAVGRQVALDAYQRFKEACAGER